MAKRAHFDAIASRYDYATRLLMMGTHDRVRDRIVSSVPPVGRALDVCCGTGYLTGHIRADSVVGVDLSTGMLSVNRRKNGEKENVNLVNGDAFTLPFEDDAFDAVFCSLASHEFENFEGILREANRVASGGAEVAIYDIYSSPHTFANPFITFLRYGVERGQFYVHTEDEWKRILRDAGFSDVSLQEMYWVSALLRARA